MSILVLIAELGVSVILRARISFRFGVKRTCSVCALHVAVGGDAAVEGINATEIYGLLISKGSGSQCTLTALQVKATGYVQGCLTSLWE